jgi:hypothetical protein
VLTQDALTNCAPTLYAVLSSRETWPEMASYRVTLNAVRRAVRRRWPDAEWAMLVEFTTGRGTRSGGRRRPHLNLLFKGIPIDDQEQLHNVLSDAWCSRLDALPRGQYVGEVSETGGLMRYLALHFQKESQQPPAGWRSHRFTTTRGYLAEPMEQARDRARAALRLRRELWKLRQEVVTIHGTGERELLTDLLDAIEVLEMAERNAYERNELGWELVRLVQLPNGFSEGGEPTSFAETPVPVSS